jgi:aminoglycoside phosphotransferase (APT) family kinase protein
MSLTRWHADAEPAGATFPPRRFTPSIELGDLVGRGTRSLVYSYGRGAVAKMPNASTPESWITAEALYAEAVRTAGAPVPRLLGIERISGRTASVWERVGGMSMWRQVLDDPARGSELGRLLADLHMAVFALVPPVALPRQRDRLASKIRRTAAGVDPVLGHALAVVPAEQDTPRVCHGDLHPSNVLLAHDGPMIVDWFDASRGDWIADVARSSLMLGDGTTRTRHLPGSDRATLGALRCAYLARLRDSLEIDDDLFACWRAVQAVGRIAEGVPREPLIEIWGRFAQTGRAQPGTV